MKNACTISWVVGLLPNTMNSKIISLLIFQILIDFSSLGQPELNKCELVKLEYTGRLNAKRFKFNRFTLINEKMDLFFIGDSSSCQKTDSNSKLFQACDSIFFLAYSDNSHIFPFMDTFNLYVNQIDTSKLESRILKKFRLKEPKRWNWVINNDTNFYLEILIENRKGKRKNPMDRLWTAYIIRNNNYRASIRIHTYQGIPIKYAASYSKYITENEVVFMFEDYSLKSLKSMHK